MTRLLNALKIGYWAFCNPQTLSPKNFEMLSSLLGLILEVADTGRHRMSHIAYIHPEEGEKQIVSMWAGVGVDANPVKRIAELLEENSKLKRLLSEQVGNKVATDPH